MQFSSFEQARAALAPGVAVIGNFDGVHLGHQHTLSKALEIPLPVVAITFDPHPLTFLKPGPGVPLLTPLEQRIQLLLDQGIHGVVVIPFTKAFARLTPLDFMEELYRELGVKHLFVGSGFRFGRARTGGTNILTNLKDFGIQVHVVEALMEDGALVSSTRIRKLLLLGEVATVPELLGRPYTLQGTVAQGLGIGSSLGFATANLKTEQLLPGDGVYSGVATHGAVHLPCLISIGSRPTMGEGLPRDCEVHIPGLQNSLLGEPLSVSFEQRIRDQQRFASPEELARAIKADLQALQGVPQC